MTGATRFESKVGTLAMLLALLTPALTVATDDVFDPDAKPTFRKLAPETTGGDFYYSRDFEPDIVIRDEPGARIQEYSVNGNTYMMKVHPKGAPAYFLVDGNGSGQYAWRRGGTNDDLLVPGWAIATW